MSVLQRHGFYPGRMISFSKTLYRRRFPKHLIVFNAKIFTRRALILQGTDLDLTIDAEKLTAAAREVGENFYVLRESQPDILWKPGSMPMWRVLSWAIWWTHIRPEDANVFRPVDSARRRPKRFPLVCITGTWESQPAYGVGYWGMSNFTART
jgi:hypothetical protein